MLLLLLSCMESPPPAPPAPTIEGLSAAAPTPIEILTLKQSQISLRLALPNTAGTTAILDEDGNLLFWTPPADPVPVPTTASLVDLTRSREHLIGLTEDGTVLLWPDEIPTGRSGDGLIAADRDADLIAVLQGGLLVVDAASLEILWQVESSELTAITIGGGQVFDFDATRLQLTARDARTGAIRSQQTIRAPHRSPSKGGKARPSWEISSPARAAPPGTPRTLQELRGALHYDPTTDRLFFRQLVLDGRTLEPLGHISGIDEVLYADQSRIIAQRRGWDGTVSVMGIDPDTLEIQGRVPLLRPEGEPHIFYDPDTRHLTLSEPGRGRLLLWNAPLTSP